MLTHAYRLGLTLPQAVFLAAKEVLLHMTVLSTGTPLSNTTSTPLSTQLFLTILGHVCLCLCLSLSVSLSLSLSLSLISPSLTHGNIRSSYSSGREEDTSERETFYRRIAHDAGGDGYRASDLSLFLPDALGGGGYLHRDRDAFPNAFDLQADMGVA